MTIHERLRQLAAALPSDEAAVTFTRADLVALLDSEGEAASSLPSRDLTVEEVAVEMGRSPSTVRSWLIAELLDGYKLRGKAWRVPRAALRAFRDAQGATPETEPDHRPVDIGAWRGVRAAREAVS